MRQTEAGYRSPGGIAAESICKEAGDDKKVAGFRAGVETNKENNIIAGTFVYYRPGQYGARLHMKRLVLPLIGFCLWGCTYAIKPTVTTIDTLTPGVVQTRPVGAALFEKGVTKMVPGFITRTTCYLPVMEHLVFPPLKKGTTFIPEGRLGNGDFLCTTAKFNRKNVFTDTGMPIERDVPR